jgi:hypothetical protein
LILSRKGGVTAFLKSVNQKKERKPEEVEPGQHDNGPPAENKENKGGTGGSPLQAVVELMNTLATNFDDSRIVIKTAPSMKGTYLGPTYLYVY